MPHKNIHSQNSRLKNLLIAACFILLISELALNGYLSQEHADYEPFPESEYINWYNAQKSVLDRLPADDDQLYRISMYGDNNYNSSALFGYAGYNTFSSSDQYALRNALYSLGISVSNRSITENGYTDLTYMLFDKGYTGNINRVGEKTDERISELDEFPWRLSIAYMVSNDIKSYNPGNDPFENQERLVKAICGKEYHFFDRLELEDLKLSSYNAKTYPLGDHTLFAKATDHSSNAGIYFSADKDPMHPFYACFRQTSPSAITVAPYLLESDDNYAENLTLSIGCILKGGQVSENFPPDTENVVIYFNDDSLESYACNEMLFARFDGSDLASLHNDLLPGILKLTKWSSSHLIGNVYATEDYPILFTSIPWDEGWEAYVDGISVECIPVLDKAFLSIPLGPGNHEVELKYIAPGAKSGLKLTVISVLILVVLILHSKLLHRH